MDIVTARPEDEIEEPCCLGWKKGWHEYACPEDEPNKEKDTMSNTIQPKYPNVTVQLTGNDGNAFTILGVVTKAMRREGISREEQSAFTEEAMSGDYDNLIQTAMKWVDVQ